MDLDDGVTLRAGDDPTIKNEVLAKSWQTTAATRLASVARDAFLPDGEPDARAHVFAAVQFLLTSNL